MGKRSTSLAVIVAGLTLAVACASPLNPSGGIDTAKLHVGVDGATCNVPGMSFTIFIDGLNVGVAAPGTDGLTEDVAIGKHAVSATQVQNPTRIMAPQVVDVPKAGFSVTVFCT
ncbi:MAG TPA: hypothetical protein VH458_11570 [Vicinamibacterales bacterium]|jgi:hypothetical protein